MTRNTTNVAQMTKPKPVLRKPTPEDGAAVWELISACKPLDENSMYFNLIQCDHFADTCVLAELDGKVLGWVSGHVPPSDPTTIFVWQVAVSKEARGMGLGFKMLNELIAREECAEVTDLQTTITSDNDASWALFRKFARRMGAPLSSAPHFKEEEHFNGAHATEYMVTIRMVEQMRKAA
ncbi:diaminobutyrate acetyltransferase [Alkalilacustris brevis]|uniref:diaminobutyrate acetyltransferase n=1 Tax=Alkalilacustris brevis TaxID=2026338 RepID=UPI000E0DB296|nr:diaminobutyrate acetyltransferase [Alkalilacustris brevis]